MTTEKPRRSLKELIEDWREAVANWKSEGMKSFATLILNDMEKWRDEAAASFKKHEQQAEVEVSRVKQKDSGDDLVMTIHDTVVRTVWIEQVFGGGGGVASKPSLKEERNP